MESPRIENEEWHASEELIKLRTENAKLRAQRDALLRVLYIIAWEPIGEPHDDAKTTLKHVEDIAKEALDKCKEGN